MSVVAVRLPETSGIVQSAYPAYRDSGISWIGRIPSHWNVVRIRDIAHSLQTGPFGSQLHAEDYVPSGVPVINPSHLRDGRIVAEASVSISEALKLRLIRHELCVGDIVFARRGELGRCGLVTEVEAGWLCGTGSLRLRPDTNKSFPPYLRWALTTSGAKDWLLLESVGSTMDNLNTAILGRLPFPSPPILEQEAITSFLDSHTTKIDALIAKKERLIALLQEKRTALISSAVTRGLDHDAPMWDSGIAWLGQVPSHWEIKKLKRLCQVKRGASPRPIDDPVYFDDAGEYAWVRISDVTASSKYLQQTEQRLSGLGKSLSVPLEPGEIFLSIAGTVGKPIITAIKCCIHDGFVYFANLKQSRDYLYYLFSSGEMYKGLGKLGTQLNLNTDTVGGISIPVPPYSEQLAIAAYLDIAVSRIDLILNKVQEHITLLQESRTALISAAVTGKIDVRGEAG